MHTFFGVGGGRGAPLEKIAMVLDLQITIARIFECYGYNSGEELGRE